MALHRRGKGASYAAPTFVELWDLKGKDATLADMAKLIDGGHKAEQFRQEVLESRRRQMRR